MGDYVTTSAVLTEVDAEVFALDLEIKGDMVICGFGGQLQVGGSVPAMVNFAVQVDD